MAKFAIELRDILAAQRRIKGHAVVTPLLTSQDLNLRTGGHIFIKAEPLQRTGSFKFRGAYNRLSQMNAKERAKGVVAYSSGNHAQGVALSAQMFGMKATIIMPKDTPQLKIDNTRGYGAEVILYDRYHENREEIGQRISSETGATLVPPYDDPYIMAGQGTVGLEIIKQMADLKVTPDILLCCCGGGGLMAGISTAVSELSPETAMYAVEPINYDDTLRSLRAGKQLSNGPAPMTICDAIMTPKPGDLTFPINHAKLKGAFGVTDQEAAEAVAYAAKLLKITAEPGGAVALAAVLSGKMNFKGKAVAVVVSGGNIDPSLHAQIIAAGGLPN